jgi:hypothetical protein
MFSNILLLIISLLPSTSFQLGDQRYATGGASSIPQSLSAEGLKKMFDPTAGVDVITKGQAQLFFLRFFAYDGDPRDPPKAYTAAFQVVVDDYSQLVIPNSNIAF